MPIRPIRPELRARAIEYVNKWVSPRPLLIGDICNHLGWKATLEESERLVEDFVHEGLLRPITKPESMFFGITHGYVRAAV